MSTQKGDNFVRNHCVSKQDPDYMLPSEDAVRIQFTRLVKTQDGMKYIRSTINAGHEQFMEIIEKYGLADVVQSRWQIWQTGKDGSKGKNLPYTE